MKMLRDLWVDVRPYLGHALMGVAAGCLFSIFVIVFAVSNAAMVSGEVFWMFTMWVLGLFVGAAITGAIGFALYMSEWDRKQWYARHAVRPARAR